MKNAFFTVFFASLLALLPLGANAVESQAAYDEVISSLAASTAPADIISSLVNNHGMTLTAATVFAMVSGGQDNRVAFATAGIGLAGNLAQAQSVANGVKATAGQSGVVADAVDAAMEQYVRTMPQPNVYEDDYSPAGGGVSPAA
jgi:hypothetical protein